MERKERKQLTEVEVRNNSKYLKEETWIKENATNKHIMDLQKNRAYKWH